LSQKPKLKLMLQRKTDMSYKKPDDKDKWSTGAKVGAAVGSAALVAALLYAGRRSLTQKKGKLEPLSPESKTMPADINQPNTDTD
jgi:hypothetical protein